jgi:D-glycero-D-manno-heptose 1,7-bisphosphate phosphatase
MAIKTIFLDRDGVINHDEHYLYKITEFKFFDGIFDACQHFQRLGYEIIIVTNQSGIARGYYKESDYEKITRWLINQFNKRDIKILDIFHCPHEPKSNCDCRKPKPGMFFQAKKKHDINMKKSWMIGDKETDIQAAIAAGIILNTILINSSSQIEVKDSKASYFIKSVNDISKIIID